MTTRVLKCTVLILAIITEFQVSASYSCVRNRASVDFRTCAAGKFSSCFPNDPRVLAKGFSVTSNDPVVSGGRRYLLLCAPGMRTTPATYRDIARCANSVGVDFRAVPLSAHQSLEDLSRADWNDWKNDINCAVRAAIQENYIPIACGTSTGALSAIYAALDPDLKPFIAGLVLFYPAIELSENRSIFIRHSALRDVSEFAMHLKARAGLRGYDSPVRFATIPNRAQSEFGKLSADLMMTLARDFSRRETNSIPVFAHFSDGDYTVNNKSSILMLRSVFPQSRIVMSASNPMEDIPDFTRLPVPNSHAALFNPAGGLGLSWEQRIPSESYHSNFSQLCDHLQSYLSERIMPSI